MKLTKIILGMGMGMAFLTGAVNAADGMVNFKGSIVDAPCSISGDSTDQTVDLGAVSSVSLESNGTSTPQNFQIDLKDCALKTGGSVTTTFTGAASKAHPDNLGITGKAAGASIVITDGAGTPIKLGSANTAQKLSDGDNKLRFSAYLQGDGSSDVTAGDFTSIADFTLAYQ